MDGAISTSTQPGYKHPSVLRRDIRTTKNETCNQTFFDTKTLLHLNYFKRFTIKILIFSNHALLQKRYS